MGFKREEIEGGVCVAFSDVVDPDDSPALKDELRRSDHTRLLIDLSRLPVITTPGLGLLVSLHKVALEEKKRLVLFGLSPYLKEIFDLTRLSNMFTIVENRNQALS